MQRKTALAALALAALLEAGGDAILRAGLRSSAPVIRLFLFSLAAAMLFAYGWTVNTPSWEFGRVLGLYVVFLFVMAQVISWIGFGQAPSRPVWIGGSLIVAGGLVIGSAR